MTYVFINSDSITIGFIFFKFHNHQLDIFFELFSLLIFDSDCFLKSIPVSKNDSIMKNVVPYLTLHINKFNNKKIDRKLNKEQKVTSK